ncbi:MAG: hypothetical protein R8J94_15495 [Acidimicrobiia bacterium]|nr:hypothetical protein [Acidimicrobiia bacterium]
MVEQHSAVRFAWLRRRDGSGPPPVLSGTRKFSLIAYNAVWWLPIALAIVGIVSARFAFLGFLAFSVFRAAVNLYRNNIMPVDQAELFPLRLP